MGRKRKPKGERPRERRDAVDNSTATMLGNTRSRLPVRHILRDVGVGILICVVFFACVEGALRMARVCEKDRPTDPFVGFACIKPLFIRDGDNVGTAEDRLKYFNEARFAADKPADEFRVFVFGGSTTYGRPFDGRTAFPRWLEELLRASLPDRHFEVINAGGISYASYRIVPLVQEALQYEPDLFVVYTGHNEFLERRTYATLFEQGRALITVRAILEEFHTYRALERLLRPLVARKDVTAEEGANGGRDRAVSPSQPIPGKTVLEEEVTAVLDRSAGLDLYHRDETFARGVARHFGHNLRSMIALSRSADVPIILVRPASNLKDFSPFKSQCGEDVEPADRETIESLLADATELIRLQQYDDARKTLEEAIRADPLYAQSHFLMGKALIGLDRTNEAAESFIKAKDLDVCPLRCMSPLLIKMDVVAREEKPLYVDMGDVVRERMAAVGDETKIPGNECFLDHVHPDIRTHQLLAEKLLATITANGLIGTGKKLNERERKTIYRSVMDGLDPRFFAEKDLNLAKVMKWAGKDEQALAALVRAEKVLDDNPEVHKIMGSLLLDAGRTEQAVTAYEKAADLSGLDPPMVFALATAYGRAGLRSKAEETYDGLVRAKAKIPEAYSNLALMHMAEGRIDEALAVLEVGLEVNGPRSAPAAAYGLALAISGKPEAGIPWMKKALAAEAGNPEYLYNLAGMLALTGRTNEALRSLAEAVRNGYSNGEKLASDEVFVGLRSEPEFKRLVQKLTR